MSVPKPAEGFEPLVPLDRRALIAVDLGAESCRVSLLRWRHGEAQITLVHRFANAPVADGQSLRWDLGMIEAGVEFGLRRCAELASEGVRSLAIDGWAVDYVRLDDQGRPLGDPFCYRDLRTLAAEDSLHRRITPHRIRAITAIRPMRINTLYQLHADRLAEISSGTGWLNLPEYLLFRLGGRRVAEYTNAGHTQLVNADDRTWSEEIFAAAGLDFLSAPDLVRPGTCVGRLAGALSELPSFADVQLIAPACHDTASAIAGIPASGDDWAYISSGTWSLVGALIPCCINTQGAEGDGFTNLAAAGGKICFHVNVNGMWLLRQCMEQWAIAGQSWSVEELVAAAGRLPPPAAVINVDEPELLLPGQMLERINAQLRRKDYEPLDEHPSHADAFASLIFHSLAARYREVLERLALHTGRRIKRVFVVGGGSRNQYLNGLIAKTIGLEVCCGSAESSTLGNFAVQLATLELNVEATVSRAPDAEHVARWAASLHGTVLGVEPQQQAS